MHGSYGRASTARRVWEASLAVSVCCEAPGGGVGTGIGKGWHPTVFHPQKIFGCPTVTRAIMRATMIYVRVTSALASATLLTLVSYAQDQSRSHGAAKTQ